MPENLVNQVIGKEGGTGKEASGSTGNYARPGLRPAWRQSERTAALARKQTAAHPSQAPHRALTAPQQLGKICPQSMRAALFTGIPVAPTSRPTGRARAGRRSLKHPKPQRELHS